MELWSAAAQSDDALFVQQCGWENCAQGHQYGPAVRDYYLMHFVASGKGSLQADGRTCAIGAGMGFLIVPGRPATYRADDKDPWTYSWVGYGGADAAARTRQIGLSLEHCVFPCEGAMGLVRRMVDEASSQRLGHLAALGGLFRLFAAIGEAQCVHERVESQYHQKAMSYMEGSYDRPIRVTDVADFVGLSRSQLFRVFKQVVGISPKEALSALRADRAAQFLRTTDLPVELVACSVGLESAARLSLLMKAHCGMSASAYRKTQSRERNEQFYPPA